MRSVFSNSHLSSIADGPSSRQQWLKLGPTRFFSRAGLTNMAFISDFSDDTFKANTSMVIQNQPKKKQRQLQHDDQHDFYDGFDDANYGTRDRRNSSK